MHTSSHWDLRRPAAEHVIGMSQLCDFPNEWWPCPDPSGQQTNRIRIADDRRPVVPNSGQPVYTFRWTKYSPYEPRSHTLYIDSPDECVPWETSNSVDKWLPNQRWLFWTCDRCFCNREALSSPYIFQRQEKYLLVSKWKLMHDKNNGLC